MRQCFSEYLIILKLADIDGIQDFNRKVNHRLKNTESANRWSAHRLIGSRLAHMLKCRNRDNDSVLFTRRLEINPLEPSVRNSNMWYLLDRTYNLLGSFVQKDGRLIGSKIEDFDTTYISTSNKLNMLTIKKINQVASSCWQRLSDQILVSTTKQIPTDKLNFFLAGSKKVASNIYKCILRSMNNT